MKSCVFGLLFALLIVQNSTAQKDPAKFGDVSLAELKMTSYPLDTSAAAVILVDYAQCYFRYQQESGFSIVLERLRRIKILKPEGLDHGSAKIRLYHNNNREEKVANLKGITFNLENGKPSETKLKNDMVFREPYDKFNDILSFSMPNVRVGCVLEISYTVYSDFVVNFHDWEFQSSIPTVWSEYRARIPEYFNYDKYTQGYVPFEINENATAPGQIVLRSKTRSGGSGLSASQTQFDENRVDFIENRFRWAAKDVPAFKDEPFLTTRNDYISRINFELAYTKFPNEPINNYMGSWEEINKVYYENSDFGGEVRGNGFLKKTVDEITAGMTKPEDKISAVVQYVKANVAWNGLTTDYSASQLKKVLEQKKGNSAEINLLLASMIEKTGLAVFPVLSSTRDHGFIRESYPQSTQFNYVLCLVRVDGRDILLDATEPLLPVAAIPERCLNGTGMAVAKDAPFWISIVNPAKTRVVAAGKFNLDGAGTLIGDLTIERTGYAGLKQRKLLLQKGEAEYLKEFTDTRQWTVSKTTFENAKEFWEPFKETYNVEIAANATSAGDVIYINPFVLLQKTSNPFKSEIRNYPVDFGFSNDEVYSITLKIPEGYVVEELPKPKVFMLPQGTSKYSYNILHMGNTITLTSSFSINKSLYVQTEYPMIREFYNQVVAKQAEQIVLKKKT
jgi:hypothetical protein